MLIWRDKTLLKPLLSLLLKNLLATRFEGFAPVLRVFLFIWGNKNLLKPQLLFSLKEFSSCLLIGTSFLLSRG